MTDYELTPMQELQVSNVKASFAMEGMPLTQEDIDSFIRELLAAEASREARDSD